VRLRTALAALLLVSCADDSIWWDLPPDMTDEQRAAFGEACERWNFVAIRQQYIADPGDGTWRVQLRLAEHMIDQRDGVAGEVIRGAHSMHLLRGMDPATFAMVAAHEQGHALRLEHHDGAGLMNEHAGQIEFSEEDLAECRRVNACR
jgi:hypothetical protein